MVEKHKIELIKRHLGSVNQSMISNCLKMLDEFDKTLHNEIKKELEVTDSLLNERQKVLDAIPECELHGPCISNALQWIEKMKNLNVTEKKSKFQLKLAQKIKENEKLTKPPLGLKPKYIHNQDRIEDIKKAMFRYFNDNKTIPNEWLKEYNSLIKK